VFRRVENLKGSKVRVQVDMYAVELGAALLLQFETPGGVVRVLADAGRKRHKVSERIDDSIRAFGGDKLRIDLMVGTHYDADHLDGLVAIIENPDIEIGEAWLPPVANDTEFVTAGGAVRDASLLALQFAGDNGRDVLRRYLNAKATMCSQPAGRARTPGRSGSRHRAPLDGS
jgi:beta-lactamase superfamily II metal-dependent hydrolase